jgi:single-strand DNA-binding protein
VAKIEERRRIIPQHVADDNWLSTGTYAVPELSTGARRMRRGKARTGQRGGTGGVGLPGIPRRIVMSQGGYVTLVGFVAQDPIQRPTKNGVLVTDLRVGATPRVQDRVTNEWRDGDTSYYDVSCWRRLGDNVRASLRKGDPVMIKGKFRSRTFTDKNGVTRTVIDIMADTVGHDLNRGVANYLRPQRRPVATEGDPAAEEPRDSTDVDEMPEDRDMIDEVAIEQFGRELDGLSEAEAAAQALEEDEATSAQSVPF